MPSLIFLTLKDLITQRLDIIANHELRKNAPDKQLKLLMQNYELIQENYLPHRREFPSILRHYIEQQSYLKALDFISEATAGQNP